MVNNTSLLVIIGLKSQIIKLVSMNNIDLEPEDVKYNHRNIIIEVKVVDKYIQTKHNDNQKT